MRALEPGETVTPPYDSELKRYETYIDLLFNKLRFKESLSVTLSTFYIFICYVFLISIDAFLLIIFFFSLVLFRLGEVLDPEAKLYMILYGDKGESGKIYLTPSDGAKFEPGKQYRVSVNIKDIGKVRSQYYSVFY